MPCKGTDGMLHLLPDLLHQSLEQPLTVHMQSVGMLRNITTFHTLATAAVERTAGSGGDGQKITYNVIKHRLGDLLYKITSQKFEDPAEGEEAIKCARTSATLPFL